MKYTKPKGSRLKRVGFRSAIMFSPGGYWFVFTNQRRTQGYWSAKSLTELNAPCIASVSSMPIKSLRAFRRRLKQWSGQLPKGTEVLLCSDYQNFEIIGVIR